MTTRRGLDPHAVSGHDGGAGEDRLADAPRPAAVIRRGDARLSSATSLAGCADRIDDDGRGSGRADASNPVLGDRRAGRNPGKPDPDRGIEQPDGASAPIAEPSRDVDQTGAREQDDSPAAERDRSGLDARRRGWFWHWNNVVTQYAPLIGLKGVGLLNSYTVWTDRRDESPHRGYAFPSQQSEAGFYGEERAELITINKILVALDLIEIRKEMLTRVDDRGRRWRVPHNLYRVKDRPDGVDLRAEDVKRVMAVACRDAAVFRYVRRVFSDRFQPIDGDNVWHTILDELRDDPAWRELQDRTRAIEARASARTRAGHQSRANTADAKSRANRDRVLTPLSGEEAQETQPDTLPLSDMQQSEPDEMPARTTVGGFNSGSRPAAEIGVGAGNNASAVAVAGSNTGSTTLWPSSVAPRGNDPRRVVDPGNTTYDQTDLTTTTTTTGLPDGSATTAARTENARRGRTPLAAPTDEPVSSDEPDTPGRAGSVRRTDRQGAERTAARAVGPATGWQVDGVPARTAVTSVMVAGIEDEREERDVERGRGMVSSGAAMGQWPDQQNEGGGYERRPTGAGTSGGARERRLADANAGGPLVDPCPLVVSTFEAANDRRATPLERRLLAELERDADSPARAVGATGAGWVVAAMREAVASGSAFVAPKRIREIIARWSTDTRTAPSAATSVTPVIPSDLAVGSAPDSPAVDVRLPGGASGSAVWSAVLGDLARALDRDAYQRLLAESRVTRYWRGSVEVRVGSVAAADKLSNEYRGLVERHLNSRLRRAVSVCFEAASDPVTTHRPVPDQPEPETPNASPQLVLAEGEIEVGRQVWQSLLADLARVVSPADLDRLAGVIVLGQDASGVILLGAPTPLARRLVDGRYRATVEASLAALLGQPSPIRVLDPAGWRVAPRQ